MIASSDNQIRHRFDTSPSKQKYSFGKARRFQRPKEPITYVAHYKH
jgi:hypothetical protein